MTDNWGYFERQTDTEMMRILMNTSWKSQAPLPSFHSLISITVNLLSIKASKTKHDKREMMVKVEQLERQLNAMFDKHEAHYIGRINTASKLEYYYYADHKEVILNELKALISAFTPYRIHFHAREDAGWEFYQYLLPNRMEELLIHNAQMIYALLHKGDRIEIPRQVYHWLFLQNEKDMGALKNSLEQSGYQIEDSNKAVPQDEFPYPMVVSKFEDVRLETLNKRVRELHQLVESFGGKYDGWGSAMRLSTVDRIRIWWRHKAALFTTLFKG